MNHPSEMEWKSKGLGLKEIRRASPLQLKRNPEASLLKFKGYPEGPFWNIIHSRSPIGAPLKLKSHPHESPSRGGSILTLKWNPPAPLRKWNDIQRRQPLILKGNPKNTFWNPRDVLASILKPCHFSGGGYPGAHMYTELNRLGFYEAHVLAVWTT